MKYRPLPPLEELKEFLDYNPNTGIFTWIKGRQAIKVGQVAGKTTGNGYVRIRFKSQTDKSRYCGYDYFAHRLAYYMYHGADPLEKLIDHIDGDKSNNKIKNLRLATVSQNQMHRVNLASDNTSGATGVVWNKNRKKWKAQIQVNKVHKFLGYFTNKEDAIKARKEGEIKYFGEFRRQD